MRYLEYTAAILLTSSVPFFVGCKTTTQHQKETNSNTTKWQRPPPFDPATKQNLSQESYLELLAEQTLKIEEKISEARENLHKTYFGRSPKTYDQALQDYSNSLATSENINTEILRMGELLSPEKATIKE